MNPEIQKEIDALSQRLDQDLTFDQIKLECAIPFNLGKIATTAEEKEAIRKVNMKCFSELMKAMKKRTEGQVSAKPKVEAKGQVTPSVEAHMLKVAAAKPKDPVGDSAKPMFRFELPTKPMTQVSVKPMAQTPAPTFSRLPPTSKPKDANEGPWTIYGDKSLSPVTSPKPTPPALATFGSGATSQTLLHLEELKAKDAEIQALKDQLSSQSQAHEKVLKAKDAKIWKLEARLTSQGILEKEIKDLQDRVESKDKQMVELKKVNSDAPSKRDVAHGMIGALMKASDGYKTQVKELKQKSCDDDTKIQALTDTVVDFNVYVVKVQLDYKSATEALAMTQLELTEAKAALEESRISEERLNSQLTVRTLERNVFETRYQYSKKDLESQTAKLKMATEKAQKLDEELKEARDLLEEYRQNDELGFEFD